MSVTPSPIGGFAAQFFDNNGVILSGGKIYTYAAGTTTPQTTYTSASGVTPHANPIILDSAGRVPGGEIWLTDGLVYKFVIETATSILLGTYDNITGVNSNFVNYTVQEEVITATAGQTVFNLSTINYTPGTNSLTVYIDGVNQYVGDSYLETDSDTVTFTAGLHIGAEVKFTTAIQTTTGAVNADIVAYDPPFTGAVSTNVEAKLAQYVSVKDFGAVGDGVADDTAAMEAAHATGNLIYYPAGVYLFTKFTSSVTAGGIVGDGPTLTVLHSTDTSSDALMVFDALWLNSQDTEDNKALVFRDFAMTAVTGKTVGACIEVTAPIVSTVQQENQTSTFDNVTFRNFATGIDFKSASFWKVINCNFIDYRVAGVKVNNIYNSDSGDGCITDCLFETDPVSSGNTGILQVASGGLKITACKFLGASYGYRMAWTGTNSSNLLISNSSFELMDTCAISLTRASGTAVFKLITITGNEIALTGAAILSDSNNWLSDVSITGNVIELWDNYTANTVGIGFQNLDTFIFSGNTIKGAGVTSVGISLTSPTNGQVGLNTYYGVFPCVDQSGAVNVPVALSEQSGTATTPSIGYVTYGASLYLSDTVTVTFDAPWQFVPEVYDVTLTSGDGSGTVAAVLDSITTTQMVLRGINAFNNTASTIYWKVKGFI